MIAKIKSLFFIGWMCLSLSFNFVYGQSFELNKQKNTAIIPFKIVRNAIVIQLRINKKGPFNFILDTGVGLFLITDSSLVDSIQVKEKRYVKLKGLGEDAEINAFIIQPQNIELPNMHSDHVGGAVLSKDEFGLSNYTGIPIHGLLGYEFFKNVSVKINFADSTLIVKKPGQQRLLKGYQKVPISIEANKPFMHTKVDFFDNTSRNCKVIVDLGAGHALSLENFEKNKWPISYRILAYLGASITGPIHGTIGRVTGIKIGKYTLKDVLTSLPDQLPQSFENEDRVGNIGLELLKKFNLVFDYSKGFMYFKANSSFTEPFENDMSGMEYIAIGDHLKRVIISRIMESSPADEIGLQVQDEILSINLKPVSKITLDQMDLIFKSKAGRSLVLEIARNNVVERVILTLRKRI